jgi:hypothetical protein
MVNPYITRPIRNGVIPFFFYAKPMSSTISRDLLAGSDYIRQEWIERLGMDPLFLAQEGMAPRIIKELSVF